MAGKAAATVERSEAPAARVSPYTAEDYCVLRAVLLISEAVQGAGMSDDTQVGVPQAGSRTRGQKLLLAALAVAGGLVLVMWSFVLPILGIVHIVEMLG